MTNLTRPAPQLTATLASPKKLAGVRIAGRMSHHQTTSIEAQLSALGIAFDADPTTKARLGRPASPWSLAWTSGYSVYTHPKTRRLAARITPAQLLRVRPIVTATPEGRS